MTTLPRRHRFTVEEYYQLAGGGRAPGTRSSSSTARSSTSYDPNASSTARRKLGASSAGNR